MTQVAKKLHFLTKTRLVSSGTFLPAAVTITQHIQKSGPTNERNKRRKNEKKEKLDRNKQ